MILTLFIYLFIYLFPSLKQQQQTLKTKQNM